MALRDFFKQVSANLNAWDAYFLMTKANVGWRLLNSGYWLTNLCGATSLLDILTTVIIHHYSNQIILTWNISINTGGP